MKFDSAEIIDRGYRDYVNGVSIRDNPYCYVDEPEQFDFWESGWLTGSVAESAENVHKQV